MPFVTVTQHALRQTSLEGLSYQEFLKLIGLVSSDIFSDLGEQLQQAKQRAEQFKSMLEANESLLSDLNKVICLFEDSRNRLKQMIA